MNTAPYSIKDRQNNMVEDSKIQAFKYMTHTILRTFLVCVSTNPYQESQVTCMRWFPHGTSMGRNGMQASDIRMLAVGYSSGKVSPNPRFIFLFLFSRFFVFAYFIPSFPFPDSKPFFGFELFPGVLYYFGREGGTSFGKGRGSSPREEFCRISSFCETNHLERDSFWLSQLFYQCVQQRKQACAQCSEGGLCTPKRFAGFPIEVQPFDSSEGYFQLLSPEGSRFLFP